MADSIIQFLLTNPVVLGAIITTVLTWVHTALVKVDTSGKLTPYSQYLHQAFLVVAFLASLLDAASKNSLASVDLTSTTAFIQYWVLVLVGGKAMSATLPAKK